MVLICLFVYLGLWQLDRAEQKKILYAEFQNRQSSEAMDLNLEKNHKLNKEAVIWRKTEAKGKFLDQYQILLDNQVEDTHAGYFVYTPFKLDRSNNIVLVNRGWLLADADRTVAPDLVLTDSIVKIIGVLKEAPNTGLLLQETPPEKMEENIYRVQRISLEEIEDLTKEKLLPYIIRLEPESEHGYTRNWRLPGSGENKNYGYAFQWFTFAVVLLIIYLVLNIKKIQGKTNE